MFVQTGYYLQLNALLMVEELYDAACVAEGLFLTLVCLVPALRFFLKGDKYVVIKQYKVTCAGLLLCHCEYCVAICLPLSVGIAYLVALFRFAESGFFSLSGGAAWLVAYGFVVKLIVGIGLLRLGMSSRYDAIREVFDVKKAEKVSLSPSASPQAYNMETIDVEKNVDTEGPKPTRRTK